jgi:hypothetical protein
LNIISRGTEAGFGANIDIIKNNIKMQQEEASDLRKRNLDRIEHMRQEGVKINADKEAADALVKAKKEAADVQNTRTVEATNAANEFATSTATTEAIRKQNTAAALEETNKNTAIKLAETNAAAAAAPKTTPGVNMIDGKLYIGTWHGKDFTPQRLAGEEEIRKFKEGERAGLLHTTNDKGDLSIINSETGDVKTVPGVGKTKTGETTSDSGDKQVNTIRKNLAGMLAGLEGEPPTQAQAQIIKQTATQIGLDYRQVKVKDKKGNESTEWQLVELTPGKGHVETAEEAYNRKHEELKRDKEAKGKVVTTAPPSVSSEEERARARLGRSGAVIPQGLLQTK